MHTKDLDTPAPKQLPSARPAPVASPPAGGPAVSLVGGLECLRSDLRRHCDRLQAVSRRLSRAADDVRPQLDGADPLGLLADCVTLVRLADDEAEAIGRQVG